MELWGQMVGIVAMAAIILSFQCKSNKKLIVVIGAGALMFAISYFMLGQPSAALFNIVSAVCSIVCLKEELKTKLVFFIIVALYLLATYITFDSWWSVVLMSAQIATSYSLMFKSGAFIRNMRLFFVSPIWLINNSVICLAIGGLICEVITMMSIIISFIRYRKTGFEE